MKTYETERLKEQMEWLQTHFLAQWVSTRKQVFNEMSESQSMVCRCGALATGMHEYGCWTFNIAVNKETVKRLKHLLLK